MKLFKFEKEMIFVGSPLPMGDIDVPDQFHSEEAVTASSKEEATIRLQRMADRLRAVSIIRRTAGGVHAYFMRRVSPSEWAEIHTAEGGDPLYTRFTLRNKPQVWWDRLSPKPGRTIDDNPRDWWVYVPRGAYPPEQEMVNLWHQNDRARKLAHRRGVEEARQYLIREGYKPYQGQFTVPPPPPPRLRT